MSGERIFDQLFAGAASVSRERLDTWFDEVAGTLGGDSAVKTVQELVGHAASFDLSALKDVPPVDLPDLLPFFQGLLALNHRRPKIEGYALSFKTPDEWITSHTIRRAYEGLFFDRSSPPGAGDLMGVGHPLMEKALQQASRLRGSLCLADGLDAPLQVIAVSNRVTDKAGATGRLIFGIQGRSGQLTLLKDWEVLRVLNQCSLKAEAAASLDGRGARIQSWMNEVAVGTPDILRAVELPFVSFHVSELALLWVD